MKVTREITKDLILSKIAQEDIFSKYLDISLDDIREAVNHNRLIESVFRFDDNLPSLGFKYSTNGKLKGRDFSGYFWGDCFDAVAFVLRKNVNNKQHFQEILKDIAARFKLCDGNHVRLSSDLDIIRIPKEKTKRIFTMDYRNYNGFDLSYWKPRLLTNNVFNYLIDRQVFAVDKLYIDSNIDANPKYYYKPTDPAYDYYLGLDNKGIENHKIYLPNRKYPFTKFLTNCNAFQNAMCLKDSWDVLLITKAYKEVLSIESFIDESESLEVQVLAPPAENYIFTSEMITWFASKTRRQFKDGTPAIISLYDMDYAGLKNSGNLKRQFHIPRFMFSTGVKGSQRLFNGKDFTDNIMIEGKMKMQKIVNSFLQHLKTMLC